MFNSDSSPTLINCTISGNRADFSGGGMTNSYGSSPTVTGCILWGDSPDEIVTDAGSAAAVEFSNVQGGVLGTGNIDADPLFVDPGNDDLELQGSSPCIDTGDPTSAPDPDGTNADMGAFFFPQFEFLRGDLDPDGNINGIVDGLFLLGWQFLGGVAPPCMDSADADDSGDVNGLVDSLHVLNFQFVPGSLPPPAPYPGCGADPTVDGTGCDAFPGCP